MGFMWRSFLQLYSRFLHFYVREMPSKQWDLAGTRVTHKAQLRNILESESSKLIHKLVLSMLYSLVYSGAHQAVQASFTQPNHKLLTNIMKVMESLSCKMNQGLTCISYMHSTGWFNSVKTLTIVSVVSRKCKSGQGRSHFFQSSNKS